MTYAELPKQKNCWKGILRGEWGYLGIVVSDWWIRGKHYKKMLAGNDGKMGCGFPNRMKQAMELGAVTREDLTRYENVYWHLF